MESRNPSDGRTERNQNCLAGHGDEHSYVHRDCYPNADANGDQHRNAHGDEHPDVHRDCYPDANANGDQHRNARGDGDRYLHPVCHHHTDANGYAGTTTTRPVSAGPG